MLTTRTLPIWTIVPAALTIGTPLSAGVATVILDVLLEGPGPASVTTRVPGFVYATATVMKVCMVVGVGVAVVAVVRRALAGPHEHAYDVANPLELRFPFWGIIGIALAPLTPVVGAVSLILAQALAPTPESLSKIDMSRFSRVAVIVSLFLISAGAMAAITSLVKREHPLLLPALGLVINAVLIGLFWHFQFYAVGFDQDTWAPR